MLDFFNITFWQGVVGGLLVLLISIWLGGRSTTICSGKGWKIVVILSYIMIFGGILLTGHGAGDGGFQNQATGGGITLLLLGIVVKYVGRFFIWWHK